MRKLLLVDSPFLCYRAAHTTGHLAHNGDATGVVYGFLRDIDTFRSLFSPDAIVFAFDYGGRGFRGQLYPEYKANRKSQWTEEQTKAFRKQVKKIAQEILPQLGFKNIITVKMYEADDIIAQAAMRLKDEEEAIIISADKDLWQCLGRDVSMYNPISKTTLTTDDFIEKWGIYPPQWAGVKALSGCPSDNIKGIEGIGELSAARWLANKLKPGTQKYELINKNLRVFTSNMPLVSLPFQVFQLPQIKDDEYLPGQRIIIDTELGFSRNRGRRHRTKKTDRVGFF